MTVPQPEIPVIVAEAHAAVRDRKQLIRDLTWRFQEAGEALELPSNYDLGLMLSQRHSRQGWLEAIDTNGFSGFAADRVDAIFRARAIDAALARLSDRDRATLFALWCTPEGDEALFLACVAPAVSIHASRVANGVKLDLVQWFHRLMQAAPVRPLARDALHLILSGARAQAVHAAEAWEAARISDKSDMAEGRKP